MLPSFTLLCNQGKKIIWENILDMLELSGYATIKTFFEHEDLLQDFNNHVGEDNIVNIMDQHLLKLAQRTNQFLLKNRKEVCLVEGDKGKVVGLMKRNEFVKLCDEFVKLGMVNDRYVEFLVKSEDTFLRDINYYNQALSLQFPVKL